MSEIDEETIARAMMRQFYDDWFAPGRPAAGGRPLYFDFVNGRDDWRNQARAVLALVLPAIERARAEGLEAAAQYLEACDDYGDRFKAAEIRAIRKG